MPLPAARLGTWREPTLALPPAVKRDYSLAWPTPMLWGMFGGGGSNTGVPVTPISALQSAAVYGCVKCLSEDIAKLPLQLRKLLPDGGHQVDTDHPLNLLLKRPNRWMTPFQFWAYMLVGVLLRGNAMAAVVRGPDGAPESLIPLNWDRVSVLLSPAGWLYYLVSHPMLGDGLTLRQDDVIHLRNPMCVDGGYLGVSPIALGQDVIGLDIATRQHGSILFRQGTQMSGFLKTAGALSPEAATRVAQSWMNTYGGVQNSHKVAVLEQGMDFVKIGMTSEDAQFLETRGFQRVEICALFRVPPHKLQDQEHAHFDNLELSEQAYVNDALTPLAVEIQQRAARVLLFKDESDYSLAFDFDKLLQADFKTRMEAYQVAIQNGIMSRNEARRREGLNPYAGGDVFLAPLNMAAAGAGAPSTTTTTLAPIATPEPEPPGDAAPIATETADQAVP